tara:strand:+ start:370 stop:567 length:198 start_codon:yes stop_codon:yes gene_type:complete
MKATVQGETAKATEYKKELIVTACGLDWFEFSNGWRLEWSDITEAFILHGIKGRLMARHCYIEIG